MQRQVFGRKLEGLSGTKGGNGGGGRLRVFKFIDDHAHRFLVFCHATLWYVPLMCVLGDTLRMRCR